MGHITPQPRTLTLPPYTPTPPAIRREAEKARPAVDAPRKEHEKAVVERGERRRVVGEWLGDAEPRRREGVRQRLVAPPERVAERPLRHPGIEERFAAREALLEALRGGEIGRASCRERVFGYV